MSKAMDNITAFKKGYDCQINGPNDDNCHFSIFATPELTKAWELGKKATESEYAAWLRSQGHNPESKFAILKKKV